MDKALHKILMDLAWELKDIGCKIGALQGVETLSDDDRARLQKCVTSIEHAIDTISKK